MVRKHLILCGAAKLSSRKREWKNAETIHLDTHRETGNVNLRIGDITRTLTANLKDLELDLLDLAAYVYSADQAVSRGGLKEIDYGARWYRTFRFEVPVRQPDFWSSPDVTDELTRMLNDVSGDNFEFAFCHLRRVPDVDSYFEWGSDAITNVDEVMLFSGGLDSFGGAVHETFCQNRKVVLVSHRPVSKIESRQKQLVADLAGRVTERRKAPVHVPILVNKSKELGKEYTQRTRSFLYASLAAIVARLFRLSRIRFYENGVTGLNLPLSPQIASTRATRTTHPMVLAGYQRLFSRVFDQVFQVENPFAWKTKTEILGEIKAAGMSRLCAFTSSCAHTWQQTKMHTHCGTCSQCVDRRLVALAAGLGDDEDPPEMYGVKFLTEPLEGTDRILVESCFETIRRIQKLDDATKFCVEFPELSRAINHIRGTADEAAQAIFDLYRRHAKQVGDALDAQGRAAIPALRLGELPSNCGLAIAFSPGGRPLPGASPSTDQVSRSIPRDGLVVDPDGFSVQWNGKGPFEIGNKKEFWLLNALSKSPKKYIAFSDLSEQIGNDEQDKVTHIKSRLVTLLRKHGLADLASLIKTQKEHYGLFIGGSENGKSA